MSLSTATNAALANEVSGSGDGKNSDPFLSNDFYPLSLSHNAVLRALRADETATDADLYKRMASSSTMGADGQGHIYRTLDDGLNDSLGGSSGSRVNRNVGVGTSVAAGVSSPSTPDVYNTVTRKSMIPLPPYLTNIIKETKLSSLMGVLPEGNMVWVSVDDALYLWEYGSLNGGRKKDDFVCFKVPSGQCIVSVGIVRPKPGVFKDIVEWCLVVTTPEEAIICALARKYAEGFPQSTIGGDSHLELIPTRYEIPTDSVPLLSICGTDDGRIFMGGYDGCLYEMSYEGFSAQKKDGRFYDDEDFNHDYGTSDFDTTSIAKDVAFRGKRAISALVLGPSAPSSQMRARKCRKMNHSSVAPPIISAIVPGFVLRASSAVFGSKPNLTGGAITKLILDRGRKTMYALTVNGFIHAFDLDIGSGAKSGFTVAHNPPKLACTVNITKSARRYLESVSHGKMYPPSSSGTDSMVASISFPGGGSAAQAGVGGMDGARSILKTADNEVVKNKSNSRTQRSNGIKSKTRKRSVLEGCLHPISIHVVPPSESKFLTLVAISSGGLRYYLSVLPDAGTSFGMNSLKPSRRFTLCHIRAPPLYSIGANHDLVLDSKMRKGASPRMTSLSTETKGRVSKSCYASGVALLAIQCGQESDDENAGDAILALTPDYTSGFDQTQNNQYAVSYSNTSSRSGLNEVALLPTVMNGDSSVGSSILRGGHVWEFNIQDLETSDANENPLMNLFTNSTTPSDATQGDKILPPFLPPSAGRNVSKILLMNSQTPSKTSLDAAMNASQTLSLPSYGITSLIRTIIFGRQPVISRPRMSSNQGRSISYRISDRFGCDRGGFSSSSVAKTSNGFGGSRSIRSRSSGQSARLSPSVAKPLPTPLSDMATQHLTYNAKDQGILALNSGGLHYFTRSSPIDKLQDLLMKSNVGNVGRDENIKSFFKSYGYKEGCTISLTIAIMAENDSLVRKAIQAALSFALRPALVRSIHSTGIQAVSPEHQITGFDGYTFVPSSLHDGIVSLLSRLLRPIWCKPAVVVTEGKVIPAKRKGMKPRMMPAKVELLLDDTTIEEVRRPLAALQGLMRDVFEPAVKSIPGTQVDDTEMMDASSIGGNAFGGGDLITGAVQYQSQARSQNNARDQQPSGKDLDAAARLHEERNLHALYRLVSRTVQLLKLMSHLYRAHLTPALPEVEFGLLHGLTYAQLVTLKSTQNRIEAMLNDIFSKSSLQSSNGSDTPNPMSSVESDNLSSVLSRDCYLFFSIGSRLTFLGFRNAQASLTQSSISTRNELVKSSSTYLRQAAKHWHSAAHVTGKMTDGAESHSARVNYNELAVRALEMGSPLARAAAALMEMGEVVDVVEVCLTCAQNFDSTHLRTNDFFDNEEMATSSMLPWERALYHRQVGGAIDNTPSAMLSTNATQSKEMNKTMKNTCYAVLCYHINILLEQALQEPQKNLLVERMLSTATSSPDKAFIHGLYDYLSTSGHEDTLLRIDNSSLENWLQVNSKDRYLLWKYYSFHNINWMAGEVMWNHGNSPAEEKVPLEERLECLTRAMGSYSDALRDHNNNNILLKRRIASSSSAPTDSLSQRYGIAPSRDELKQAISRITEQIDVAKIQTRVLSTILSSRNVSNLNQEQIDLLRHSLVTVSVLYNDFTGPLGLYDLCLAILQTCEHNDTATINKLWRSILCEELLPCRTSCEEVSKFLKTLQKGSMLEEESVVFSSSRVTKENGESLLSFEDGDWISAIKSRVIALGNEFHGKDSDFVFPLHFIAECLEGLSTVYNSSSATKAPGNWALRIIAESGASFASILEAYHSIFVSKTDSNANTKLKNISNIGEVIKMWMSSANSATGDAHPSKVQLDRYSNNIVAQIDMYKAELESLVGCKSEEVSNVYSLFNDIEKTLRQRW